MPAADPPPPTSPALPERVREVLPTVPALVRRVRAVAFVSAGAAVVLWGLVLGPSAWPLSGWTVVALLGLGVLLVPAGGTLVAVWTLEEVAALPARLRALPGEAAARCREWSLALYHRLGCRDVARVDFIVNDDGPWFLEINTMPGFTTHSLVPMAAAALGWNMPALCARLVDAALARSPAAVLPR